MGTSSITITALTATPTLRGNKLKATVSAIGPAANLPNLTLKTVAFYASTTNDYTTATEIARGNPEALDAGLIEEQTYYYWAFAVDNSDNTGAVFPVSPTGGVACTAIGMSGLALGLANGRLVATVAASALTIAIKTNAGSDPDVTAGGSVYVAFPNPDVTIGNYQIRRISTALSITVPQFGTLGLANNTPFRVWVVLFDDAGVLRLGVKVCANSVALISPISESAPASSSAVASAILSYIFYTDQPVTSKALRVIGECVWNSGLAAVGVWNVNPSTVRLVGAGASRPGQSVQEIAYVDRGVATSTALIPFDDSKPQVGEGFEIDTFNLTAAAACNMIDIEKVMNVSHSAVSEMVCALFVDGAADAVAADFAQIDTAGKLTQITFRFRVFAGSISQRTYSFRLGAANAGTTTLNGSGGSRKLGDALYGYVRAQEVLA